MAKDLVRNGRGGALNTEPPCLPFSCCVSHWAGGLTNISGNRLDCMIYDRTSMQFLWCLAGLEGRETEGEAQCALLSLCGERVRGGVLTWEAAR